MHMQAWPISYMVPQRSIQFELYSLIIQRKPSTS
jgi:hypothetical protein